MVDNPLEQQIKHLIGIISKNPYITAILNSDPFPNDDNWYLGAGCICQSVWNHLSDREITDGIKDYDLVYYDAKDTTRERVKPDNKNE